MACRLTISLPLLLSVVFRTPALSTTNINRFISGGSSYNLVRPLWLAHTTRYELIIWVLYTGVVHSSSTMVGVAPVDFVHVRSIVG